jgi:hypothetical protein
MKLLASVFCAVFFLTACNTGSNQEKQLESARQTTIDSMKVVLAKQAAIDSMNRVMADREEELRAQNEEKNRQIEATNNVAQNNAVAAAPAAQKKKWSHTAKGAVVGAGTGAATGAIINKNRAEGAIIGTLIGAGVGAGTGAIVDASKKKKNKGN